MTYGKQYDARQADKRTNVHVGTGLTSMAGVEEPRYYWVPSIGVLSIGPSGMMFYTSNLFQPGGEICSSVRCPGRTWCDCCSRGKVVAET